MSPFYLNKTRGMRVCDLPYHPLTKNSVCSNCNWDVGEEKVGLVSAGRYEWHKCMTNTEGKRRQRIMGGRSRVGRRHLPSVQVLVGAVGC